MSTAERDIKVVRPLYSVEVTETETAKFETEISEEDVHGNWKLKGEALHQSAVSHTSPMFLTKATLTTLLEYFMLLYIFTALHFKHLTAAIFTH